MHDIELYIFLFAIIIITAQLFNKISLPVSIILVIVGLVISQIPYFSSPNLNSEIVLNIFLPLLIYQIASFSSWIDIKKNLRPIALLSVGHVLFLTCIIAYLMHSLLPELGWPLAFVIGAVLSPPDDVAIISIAEKIRIPSRVYSILVGEGLLNDATALIIFRFSLAAAITHEFILSTALFQFIFLLIFETIYGLALGNLIGNLRMKITNTKIHMMASLLTPFLAYLPCIAIGGSGILATAITGFIIGHKFAIKFTPEFRIVSRSLWPTFTFMIDCLLFLWVGLNAKTIYEGIAALSIPSLLFYAGIVVLTVIVSRFFWVYVFLIYLPRILIPGLKKRDPYPPWQFPFFISWAGMRGSISLAAALSVPMLPQSIEGVNLRFFIIYLVFSVIVVTFLLQGLSLPWLIKKLGLSKYTEKEEYDEHLTEIYAREQITDAILRWLKRNQRQIKNDPKLLSRIKAYIQDYEILKSELKEAINKHNDESSLHDFEVEKRDESFLELQISEIERTILIDLWKQGKINLTTRNILLNKLDHRVKRMT